MIVYDPIQNRWQTGGGCTMSDLVIYRFQPDAMDEDVLRRLLVGSDTLLQEMRNEYQLSSNIVSTKGGGIYGRDEKTY